MRVIAHGGAGSPPRDPDGRRSALRAAVEDGVDARDPVAAVCEAVGRLEADPRFNAGVGGAVQSDGVPRTDAGLMEDDGTVGAACAMPGVRDAVEVARVVAGGTPHVLVAGVHAVDLAAAHGVETGVDLWSDRSRERWASADPPAPTADRRDHLAWVRERFGTPDDGGEGGDGEPDESRDPPRDRDTVGAVARDGDRLAAAASTGGRWFALAGRVGDVPQVGAGFFCSRAGGASATGHGEEIARATLARRAVDHLEMGRSAEAAADLAIEEFADRTGGEAGVVVMGNDGDAAAAHNAAAMQTAVADDDSE